jgi:hypothetical protein
MRKIMGIIVSALLLMLSACGQAAPSVGQPAPGAATAPPPAPTSAAQSTPQPTATLQPTEAPAPTQMPAQATTIATPDAGTGVRPPDTLVAEAQRRLAQYLGVQASDLALQSANQQIWPDGALGCPQPDQIYPQVVTPGFLLVFSNTAQTTTHELHTDMGEQMVLCENKQRIELPDDTSSSAEPPAPTPAGGAADAASQPLVDRASQDLAQQLSLKAEDITLVGVEEVEWRNSSLGCPRPGMNYLQVITPGYRITLEAQGKRYEYHTDQSSRVVRCDNPSS